MKQNGLLQMETVMMVAKEMTRHTTGSDGFTQIHQLKGEWTGKCRSVVSWYNRDIPIRLIIKDKGVVEGEIGDAALSNGKLKENHNIFTRLLHLSVSEFRIDADLIGAMVKKEKIIRKQITILFNAEENQLTGGFTTSGTKFGGKSHMRMSAYKMRLVKTRTLS